MKNLEIKTKAARKRIATMIENDVRGAVSIFTDKPTVERYDYDNHTSITIENRASMILTQTEVEEVFGAFAKWKEKYGIGYVCLTFKTGAVYSQTFKDWLHMPAIEILVMEKLK